ncbi:MAG: dioxygenase [Gammaproteobacteria bacterium]|nr:dioxygenase [Gammaproteobacteria bacterium]
MKDNPTVLFLSHGGGPLPLLGDKRHMEMVECLKGISSTIVRPSAILVVSAHWEAELATITSGQNPSLIYDYYGFPIESYSIDYPCPGEPALAFEVYRALKQAGIEARLDEQRGFDHGLFVPLKIMYPDADIPCVQLSLINNLDPSKHIAVGQALQSMSYKNLLVIGSGFSFHNLKAFFSSETSETKAMNESFEDWLIETCTALYDREKDRANRLIQWEGAPSARYCHPREEHLLPLHICYGITQTACSSHFELRILNRKSSMYLWSPPYE